MRYGYVRVSTNEQNLTRWRAALTFVGCNRMDEEVENAAKVHRCLDRARRPAER